MGLVFDLCEAVNIGWSVAGGATATDLRERLNNYAFRRAIAKTTLQTMPDSIKKAELRRLLHDPEFLSQVAVGGLRNDSPAALDERLLSAGVTADLIGTLADGLINAFNAEIRRVSTPVEKAQNAKLDEIIGSQKGLAADSDDIYNRLHHLGDQTGAISTQLADVSNKVDLLADKDRTPGCDEVRQSMSARSQLVADDYRIIGDRSSNQISLEQLYIHREAEAHLAASSGRSLVALVGEAGHGKSSMLWSTYRALHESGEVCWLVRASSLSLDEHESASIRFASDLEAGVACVRDVGGRPTILIDTVDTLLHESRNRDHLLLLLNRIADLGARIIVACRPVEFQLLPSSFERIPLGPYSENELYAATRTHEHAYATSHLPAAAAPDIQEAVRWGTPLLPVVSRPLTLRMLFDLYAPETLPPEINTFQLFAKFWDQRVSTDSRPGDPIPADIQDLSNCAEASALALLGKGMPSAPIGAFPSLSVSDPDLVKLRARAVLTGPTPSLEFFHQSFFEFAAGRAVVRSGLLRQLVSRSVARPSDSFLWPIVEQAMLHSLELDDEIDYCDRAAADWCDGNNLAFDTALGVWSLSSRPLPRLQSKLMQIVESAGSKRKRAESILNRLSSLLSDRNDEVIGFAKAAWASGDDRLRLAVVKLLPTIAGRSTADLKLLFGFMGLPKGVTKKDLGGELSAVAEALVKAGWQDSEWAASTALAFATSLTHSRYGNFGDYVVRGLAESRDRYEPASIVPDWVKPLADAGIHMNSGELASLLASVSSDEGQSPTEVLNLAKAENGTLGISLVRAACQLGSMTDANPESIVDSLLEFEAEVLNQATDDVAALLESDDLLIESTLSRLLVLEVGLPEGVVSALCDALALVDLEILGSKVSHLPAGIPDEAWLSTDRFEPLLTAMALAGEENCQRVLAEAIPRMSSRQAMRVLAKAGKHTYHNQQARELVVELATRFKRPMGLARQLETLQPGSEEWHVTSRILADVVTALVDEGDANAKLSGLRVRRNLLDREVSIEQLLESPMRYSDWPESIVATEQQLLILRQRAAEGLDDPGEVHRFATEHMNGPNDENALHTALTAVARFEDEWQAWTEAARLITLVRPGGRHIMSMRYLLNRLAASDAKRATDCLVQVAEEIPSMSKGRSKKESTNSLFEPIARTLERLEPAEATRLIERLAAAHNPCGPVAVTAAARSLGPNFVVVAQQVLDRNLVPDATARELSNLVSPLTRSLGSSAWPELKDLIS